MSCFDFAGDSTATSVASLRSSEPADAAEAAEATAVESEVTASDAATPEPTTDEEESARA